MTERQRDNPGKVEDGPRLARETRAEEAEHQKRPASATPSRVLPRKQGPAEPPDEDGQARLALLLHRPELLQGRNAVPRGDLLGLLQRRYGNRSILRWKALARGGPEPRRSQAGEAAIEHGIDASKGAGHALDPATRASMESGFGRDFGGVRVHTDNRAGQLADALGAQAFTTGRDVYFGAGRYQPQTEGGRHLLAHELAHTVQQGQSPAKVQHRLQVGAPDSLLEKAAERAADAVTGRGQDTVPAPAREATGLIQQEDDEPPPAPPAEARGAPAKTGAPAAATAGGDDLVIALGEGLPVPRSKLEGRGTKRVELTGIRARIPGLAPKELVYRTRSKTGYVKAELDVPFARGPRGGLELDLDKEGKVKLLGSPKLQTEVGILNAARLQLGFDETTHLPSASATISASNLKPRGAPAALHIGGTGVKVVLKQGKLEGEGGAELAYKGLAKGKFGLKFEAGAPRGSGSIELTPEYLKGAKADLQIDKGDLKTAVSIPANRITPPIAGLAVKGGTVKLGVHNTALSGSLDRLHLSYRELGEANLSAAINRGRLERGDGTLTVRIPAIDPVQGKLGYRGGRLYGEATIGHDKLPKSLPISGGQVTVGVDHKGAAVLSGKLAVDFRGVGGGELRGAYKAGKLELGADVRLRIPGLQNASARVDYVNGDLEGAADIPIDSKRLRGISANLHVEYKQKRWKAEQKVNYSRDDGKVSGSILLGAQQDAKGKLGLYGGGDVTAQLTSFLQGQLQVDIKPEGKTHLEGAITVTKPIELFPEKKLDRELFNVSRNIPLWAILIAVIRLRGGVRAGVGPGQLRDIRVAGEYTVGQEGLPAFTISGELFIPAFAEAYLAFGVGLGLSVVLGSLTGGIEAVATAGIYGAVSVRPEIAYQNGNYSISGVATMAAGARLKLGLQAWAEIEALWFTVWEKTWQLAEWVWSVGPNLAMQASMKYTFGQPKPPSFEFKTSDIDANRLIQDAMPKSGPKGSGAREAIKNRAQWKGRTKGKGKSADKVPPEVAGKAKKAGVPKAPPKPSKRPKPTGKEAPKRPVKEVGGKRKAALDKMIKKAAKKKEKDKKLKVTVPSFPPPNKRQKDVMWANFLAKHKRPGMTRDAFDAKMGRGEVYHRRVDRWNTLKNEYKSAYPYLGAALKQSKAFSDALRSGRMAGSNLTPDGDQQNIAVPGQKDNPYPIHWPNAFKPTSFESFSVRSPDGRRLTIPPQPRASHYLKDANEQQRFDLGVAGHFAARMAIGQKLKRYASNRGSATAQEWDKWRRMGFRGGKATLAEQLTEPATPASGGADNSMFRVRHWPGEPDKKLDTTFGKHINTDPQFSEYQATARQADKDRIREKARQGKLDITNPNHVRLWREHFDKIFEERQPHVLGYQMQHVMPLFLIGPVGDRSPNLWPLDVGSHQGGHDVLQQQPQIKELGAPTHDLENTLLVGQWFIIERYV